MRPVRRALSGESLSKPELVEQSLKPRFGAETVKHGIARQESQLGASVLHRLVQARPGPVRFAKSDPDSRDQYLRDVSSGAHLFELAEHHPGLGPFFREPVRFSEHPQDVAATV